MPSETADGSHLARFAADLRELHDRAGRPDYRQLCESTHFGRTVLSAALNGNRLPSWPVTRALVEALGGDPEQWRERWGSAAHALPGHPVLDRPRCWHPQAVSNRAAKRSAWLGRNRRPLRRGSRRLPLGNGLLEQARVPLGELDPLGLALEEAKIAARLDSPLVVHGNPQGSRSAPTGTAHSCATPRLERRRARNPAGLR